MSANVESRFFGDMGDDYKGLWQLVDKLDEAFLKDDVEFISLYEKYVKLISKYEKHYTSLEYVFVKAIKHNKEKIFNELEKIYQPKENAAVFWAAKINNYDLIYKLVSRGLKDNLALKAAYENNNITIFLLLFNAGMRYREDGARY